MFTSILIGVLSLGVLSIPLVFWFYIFTEFGDYKSTRGQFFLGLVSGVIVSLGIASTKIFDINILYNVFEKLSSIDGTYFGEGLLLYLVGFFACIWFLFYLIKTLTSHKVSSYKSFLYSYILMGLSVFIAVGVIKLIYIFYGSTDSGLVIRYGDLIFFTLASIVGYYILIAILEEGIKLISGYGFYSESGSPYSSQIFCVGASVALGFALSENIMYVIFHVMQNGVSVQILSLSFFRSIFPVLLHIFSGIFMVMGFYYALFTTKKNSIKILSFIAFSMFSLFSHAVYDISLSFGYPIVMFFYMFGTYLLISYVLFRKNI